MGNFEVWDEAFPEFVHVGERRNEHQQLRPFMRYDVPVVVSISVDSGQTETPSTLVQTDTNENSGRFDSGFLERQSILECDPASETW